MFSNRRKQKDKPYRSRKTGAKDVNIDLQILAIHRAIADKLLKHPDMVARAMDKVEAMKDDGRLGYGAYLTWQAILELADRPDAFRNALLENTPRMNRLRRATPLTGVLSEQERARALAHNSAGTTSVETLL